MYGDDTLKCYMEEIVHIFLGLNVLYKIYSNITYSKFLVIRSFQSHIYMYEVYPLFLTRLDLGIEGNEGLESHVVYTSRVGSSEETCDLSNFGSQIQMKFEIHLHLT